MGKNFKYIKIEGKITYKKNIRNQDGSMTMYNSVTIEDAEGNLIEFDNFYVPSRLDNQSDKITTFYILRFLKDKSLSGVLYAGETANEKIYNEKEAKAAIKIFVPCMYKRAPFALNFAIAFGASFILGGALAIAIHFQLGTDSYQSAILGIAPVFMYLYWPMLNRSNIAKFDEMETIISEAGFVTNAELAEKY